MGNRAAKKESSKRASAPVSWERPGSLSIDIDLVVPCRVKIGCDPMGATVIFTASNYTRTNGRVYCAKVSPQMADVYVKFLTHASIEHEMIRVHVVTSPQGNTRHTKFVHLDCFDKYY